MSILATECPHMFVLDLYSRLVFDANSEQLFNDVTNWIADLGDDAYAFWAPWDASPILKMARHAVVGFAREDTALLFKLTYPEVIISHINYTDYLTQGVRPVSDEQ